MAARAASQEGFITPWLFSALKPTLLLERVAHIWDNRGALGSAPAHCGAAPGCAVAVGRGTRLGLLVGSGNDKPVPWNDAPLACRALGEVAGSACKAPFGVGFYGNLLVARNGSLPGTE